MTPHEELIAKVCGPNEVAAMTNYENLTALNQAMCRCDIKAQVYLSNADRVAHDVNCDCDAEPQLDEMSRMKYTYEGKDQEARMKEANDKWIREQEINEAIMKLEARLNASQGPRRG